MFSSFAETTSFSLKVDVLSQSCSCEVFWIVQTCFSLQMDVKPCYGYTYGSNLILTLLLQWMNHSPQNQTKASCLDLNMLDSLSTTLPFLFFFFPVFFLLGQFSIKNSRVGLHLKRDPMLSLIASHIHVMFLKTGTQINTQVTQTCQTNSMVSSAKWAFYQIKGQGLSWVAPKAYKLNLWLKRDD